VASWKANNPVAPNTDHFSGRSSPVAADTAEPR
jgi:hypothetical protein